MILLSCFSVWKAWCERHRLPRYGQRSRCSWWTPFKYLAPTVEIWMFCSWIILLWHRRESADWCWNQVHWRPASMCRLRVWYVIIVSNYGYCIFYNTSRGFNALYIDLYFVWYQCWVHLGFLYSSRWLDMWPKGYLSQSGSVRDPNN